MMKNFKKMIAGCLMGIICFSNSLTVYAAEDYVMGTGEVIEITETSDENMTIMPRKLYKTGDFALGSNNNYFEVDFNARNGFSDPHTRFDLKISDVSGGKWYATIESDAGYSYTSSEYSSGATITVTNLRSNVTYLVTVYWVQGTNAVTGKYTMWTSY